MQARLVEIEVGRRGAAHRIGRQGLLIGRDPQADVVLSQARISRQHARIDPYQDGHTVTDLGSTNGTQVNGHPLTAPVILRPGDLIVLGNQVTLLYEEHAEEEQAEGPGRVVWAVPAAALVVLGAAGLAFWLWSRGDPVFDEATELAAAGVRAYERAAPALAKQKLDSAVGLLYAKGRLDDVPRMRLREEGLIRLSERLGGGVNLLSLYRQAMEEARPRRTPVVLPGGRGPCRLDEVGPADLDVCIRERAEQILVELWQDPRRIPESFYGAVNEQLRLLLDRRRGWVEASLERGRPLVPMMIEELERAKMPPVLRYLAMIESGYETKIRSPAGARGPWQFMPGTARGYGLKVGPDVDERTDPPKATRAAARYLRDLAFEFGGDALLLAIASYNKGEHGIRRVLKKLDDPRTDRSYWTLAQRGLLPDETRDYVPRFVAAAVLGEAGLPSPEVLAASTR